MLYNVCYIFNFVRFVCIKCAYTTAFAISLDCGIIDCKHILTALKDKLTEKSSC